MSWNTSYIVLILFTTTVSYLAAIKIASSQNIKWKKIYLVISLVASLGVLFFYKYFNFFADSLNELFHLSSLKTEISYLNILLPVGISFYTFQTLSYTIDVYKGKKSVEKHFGIYALYVAFFPQLVAGPIERSTRLLPQFWVKHKFSWENIMIGGRWMILGFFMKLVVADRLALYVNSVYNNTDQHTGLTFIVATVLFAFQIYCDFAGYSNIAIGTAKLMGFDLMINFKRPYFALSIGDFWKRWHISLSTWFRDYFYIPIGGNRTTKLRWLRNLFLTFLVSGLWHGASWTFVIWGALHGIYIIMENLLQLGIKQNQKVKLGERLLRIFAVFVLVNIAWIFFRANSLNDAYYITTHLFDFNSNLFVDSKTLFYAVLGISILLLNDIIEEYWLKGEYLKLTVNRYITLYYLGLTLITLYIGVFNGGQFIYFQF